MADMNSKVRYNLGLLKRKSIYEREEFFKRTGRNRIIESKTKLTLEEKEELKQRFVQYYVKRKRKKLKAFLFSLLLAGLILYGLVLVVKAVGLS